MVSETVVHVPVALRPVEYPGRPYFALATKARSAVRAYYLLFEVMAHSKKVSNLVSDYLQKLKYSCKVCGCVRVQIEKYPSGYLLGGNNSQIGVA